MIKRTQLLSYLNDLLHPELFQDYAPNGLQVEGVENIQKIVTGVTANQALFEAALEKRADTILVHHGFFWQGEDSCVVGIKKKRLELLLTNQLNLIAYHLPLDAHVELGNNAQLAKVLGVLESVCVNDDDVWQGKLPEKISGEELCQQLDASLNHVPLYIPGKSKQIQSVAWCTGGAGKYIDQAVLRDVDAYITGEISESIVHVARETGIHLFVAGHHATERYGIKALGEHLMTQFDVDCEFVDIDSPM